MTKKRPSLGRRELAAKLGCHPNTVNRLVGDGLPVAERGRGGRSSRYDEIQCRRWLAARRKAAGGKNTDLVRDRARRERAQAALIEQTFALRAGRLLPASDVERVWTAEVAAVRAALLSWSTALADRVTRTAMTEGLQGVERELSLAINQVLTELSDPNRPPAAKRQRPARRRRRRQPGAEVRTDRHRSKGERA